MKVKSQRDFWSGLMFVVVGIGFSWGALGYNFGSSARPGPGYFPFGLGILLAVLGAFVLFKALSVETAEGDPIGSIALRPLIIVTVAVVIFGLALPRLGLVLTLPLLIFIASMAGDEFHWLEALVNCIVLTLASWLIFIVGLKLTIPLWPTILAGAGS